MAWIKTVGPEEATGLLKARYDEAIRRAGRIWNIVRIMSLRPEHIQTSIEGLYVQLMHRATPGLSKAQREMIAVVVSRVNSCHY